MGKHCGCCSGCAVRIPQLVCSEHVLCLSRRGAHYRVHRDFSDSSVFLPLTPPSSDNIQFYSNIPTSRKQIHHISHNMQSKTVVLMYLNWTEVCSADSTFIRACSRFFVLLQLTCVSNLSFTLCSFPCSSGLDHVSYFLFTKFTLHTCFCLLFP